jgi:hypothetical protein
MPHLLFLKRYWRFSSDDLSIPAMCSILYRYLNFNWWIIKQTLFFSQISMDVTIDCSSLSLLFSIGPMQIWIWRRVTDFVSFYFNFSFHSSDSERVVYIWLVLSHIFLTLSHLLTTELWIIVISFRGSVIDSEERMGMNMFLTAKIGIGFIQLILAIFGQCINIGIFFFYITSIIEQEIYSC